LLRAVARPLVSGVDGSRAHGRGTVGDRAGMGRRSLGASGVYSSDRHSPRARVYAGSHAARPQDAKQHRPLSANTRYGLWLRHRGRRSRLARIVGSGPHRRWHRSGRGGAGSTGAWHSHSLPAARRVRLFGVRSLAHGILGLWTACRRDTRQLSRRPGVRAGAGHPDHLRPVEHSGDNRHPDRRYRNDDPDASQRRRPDSRTSGQEPGRRYRLQRRSDG
jgi:hypothetical protein